MLPLMDSRRSLFFDTRLSPSRPAGAAVAGPGFFQAMRAVAQIYAKRRRGVPSPGTCPRMGMKPICLFDRQKTTPTMKVGVFVRGRMLAAAGPPTKRKEEIHHENMREEMFLLSTLLL